MKARKGIDNATVMTRAKNQSNRVIKVGVDFDGVVTANPLRVARPAIAFVKHQLCGVKKLSFFVPTNNWQKAIYIAGVVLPSLFPARGVGLIKTLSKSKHYQFVLVTGRFGFVKQNTYNWLKTNGLLSVFSQIVINENNEQPHEFKAKIIQRMNFDYYIEDNWDIVNKLANKLPTKIMWIYNIIDKKKEYSSKFPDLYSALKAIDNQNEGSD